MFQTVICIKLDLGNLKLLIFNYYMPTQCNNDFYASSIRSVCGFIIDQINRHDCFVPSIIGDFNFECVKGSISYDLFICLQVS